MYSRIEIVWGFTTNPWGTNKLLQLKCDILNYVIMLNMLDTIVNVSVCD